MPSLESNLNHLECVLVQEFRIFQRLYELSRRERAALLQKDAAHLHDLAQKKQQVLDRLQQLAPSRRQALGAFAGPEDPNDPTEILPTLQRLAVAPNSNPSVSQTFTRVGALCEGIHTLKERVFELSKANQSAAELELRDPENLRSYLRDQSHFQHSLIQPARTFTA